MNAVSEDQLSNCRERLSARAVELRDRLERVRHDLRREREPLPLDSDDAAIALENDEVLQAIEQTAVEELRHIDLALHRLAEGAFNLCEKCGAEIDAQRLVAVPYAATCRSCAR